MICNITGIVLHKKEWLEQDLRIVVLTNQGERLDLIVKGAGKRSRRRSHLELMNLIEGTVHHSRHNAYLQTVSCVHSFSRLKDQLELCLSAQVLLEVLDRSTQPENPEPILFELLHESLKAMEDGSNPNLVLDIALVKLSDALGYLPSLRHCGHCATSLTEEEAWQHHAGFLACTYCHSSESTPFPHKYRKAIEFFRTASFETCSRLLLTQEEYGGLREWSPRFLSRELGKPIKTWEGV